MKTFNHVMLDLETLGTSPGSVILSLAAVCFNMETGETGTSFYKKIDIASAMDAGLKIESDTLKWWLQQESGAQMELLSNSSLLKDVLFEFNMFIDKNCFVWGNSASFDCGLLAAAYKACGSSIPWNFRKERCLRTLVALNPEIKANHKWNPDHTAHNALHDCYEQISYACETWNCLIPIGNPHHDDEAK